MELEAVRIVAVGACVTRRGQMVAKLSVSTPVPTWFEEGLASGVIYFNEQGVALLLPSGVVQVRPGESIIRHPNGSLLASSEVG